MTYLRVALGVAFSRKDEFALKLSAFSRLSERRRVGEGLSLLASALSKSTGLDGLVPDVVGPDQQLRQQMFEIQVWYLMAADLRTSFRSLQTAFQEFVDLNALGVGRFNGEEWKVGKPVVLDLLVKGSGRKATLIHPVEVAHVYRMLCMTQHVPERCHVSQTNIEAVINMVASRRSQAEWFLMVVITGEVSSLSLASLVMAFTGSSGRLLLVYSSAVMEGLRVANRLPDVHQTALVEHAEAKHTQWIVVEGFGSAAADTLTKVVSDQWQELQIEEPVWQCRLGVANEVPWTSVLSTFR